MNWKHYLSVLGSAFAGGAGGWATTHLSSGIPTTAQGIEAFLVGAAIAGAAAVAHLLQPAPSSPPSPPAAS